MAIGVLFDYPDGSLDQYDEICRRLNGGPMLPVGLAGRRLPIACRE